MKKIALTLTLLISFHFSNAQCESSASNFGNNTDPDYEVTGDITVVLNDNNTVTLELGDNFSTAYGPDLRVYLVNPKLVSDTALQTTGIQSSSIEAISFGLVTDEPGSSPDILNGASSYTADIPDNVNILDFNKVHFYCLEFNIFWDFGTFEAFDTNPCTTLSIDDNKFFTETNIYPNPANNFLQINSSSQEIFTINITDVLGNSVYTNIEKLNHKIDLPALQPGLYILSLTSEKRNLSKRLVIN